MTPVQRELLPILRAMVATPLPNRENSRYMFGNAVSPSGTRPRTPAPDGGEQRIEVRRP